MQILRQRADGKIVEAILSPAEDAAFNEFDRRLDAGESCIQALLSTAGNHAVSDELAALMTGVARTNGRS